MMMHAKPPECHDAPHFRDFFSFFFSFCPAPDFALASSS
jgi:hypothetical protein